jgi:hypothetical protein
MSENKKPKIPSHLETSWKCSCGATGGHVTPKTIGIMLAHCNKGRTEKILLSDNNDPKCTNQEWVTRVHSAIFHNAEGHEITIVNTTVVDMTGPEASAMLDKALKAKGF